MISTMVHWRTFANNAQRRLLRQQQLKHKIKLEMIKEISKLENPTTFPALYTKKRDPKYPPLL